MSLLPEQFPQNANDLTPEQSEFIRKFLETMLEGKTCPHCHAPIEERYQVGRCVYAKPCGHRQYQGKLPESEEK